MKHGGFLHAAPRTTPIVRTGVFATDDGDRGRDAS